MYNFLQSISVINETFFQQLLKYKIYLKENTKENKYLLFLCKLQSAFQPYNIAMGLTLYACPHIAILYSLLFLFLWTKTKDGAVS